MRPYTFTQARSVREALRGAGPDTAFLAGGTTLVDLMKLEVMTPERVVDINRLPLDGITLDSKGLHIGALERMSDVAEHRTVREHYPMVAQALELSASAQLRNMASIGGNLLQRTRCGYFRDVTTPCNKREPGSGCAALEGINRGHAVLGTSEACIATHPSDLAVPLVALDAVVHLGSARGTRTVALDDFYTLPGATPHIENTLRPGELITGITVPRSPFAARSHYLKIRDRQSYEFALASAAVALELRGRTITQARIAVGGVGTRPWRLPAVERALT
ncbi:MAG TPA: xanthine dehydrogenase family protein subunit M, partial [Nocardioides sp.]